MTATSMDLLRALRTDGADWLAALVGALHEALRDDALDMRQRELLRGLLAAGEVPPLAAAEACRRLRRIDPGSTDCRIGLPEPSNTGSGDSTARPKLTLCGTAA